MKFQRVVTGAYREACAELLEGGELGINGLCSAIQDKINPEAVDAYSITEQITGLCCDYISTPGVFCDIRQTLCMLVCAMSAEEFHEIVNA